VLLCGANCPQPSLPNNHLPNPAGQQAIIMGSAICLLVKRKPSGMMMVVLAVTNNVNDPKNFDVMVIDSFDSPIKDGIRTDTKDRQARLHFRCVTMTTF